MIGVSEALYKLLASFSPVASEVVPLEKAAGRILSEDIKSEIDLPLFTNSSMDGFAVRAKDVRGADPNHSVKIFIVEDIPAGKQPTRVLGKNQGSRIMTGAPIPDGADAVIPIEDTDQSDPESRTEPGLPEEIEVYRSVEPGDYVRKKGEDISTNETVLESNSRLRPQDVGLLAMLGKAKLSVYRHPRIVILSTGDELLPVEAPLELGKIHDSNAYNCQP